MTPDSVHRVLIVDDEEPVRKLLVRWLVKRGIECDEAGDGVVAENRLRLKRYDMVISDLRMPRKHGYDLITNLLQSKEPPLVIAMTGVVNDRIIMDLMGKGLTDIVFKPFMYDAFSAKVRALLDRRTHRAPSQTGSAAADIAGQIESTTAGLSSQLERLTQTFQNTIQDLKKQSETLEGSVRLLADVMNQVGGVEDSHAGRVETAATAIGTRMKMSEDKLQDLKLACLLHEIGQFGMPEALRNTPLSSMSAEQRRVYERYPLIGSTLLGQIPGAERVAEIVENHAENFDGTGFPSGKAGKKIPLGARILRIAKGTDLYRSQAREAISLTQARAHVVSQKGKAYDPSIADFALDWLEQAYAATEKAQHEILPANQLKPGHVLAESVYDQDGRFLARSGLDLTPGLIQRLTVLLGDQKVTVLKR